MPFAALLLASLAILTIPHTEIFPEVPPETLFGVFPGVFLLIFNSCRAGSAPPAATPTVLGWAAELIHAVD
ncbi:unnamed protein product [Penicillium bialowiezense]